MVTRKAESSAVAVISRAIGQRELHLDRPVARAAEILGSSREVPGTGCRCGFR